MKHDGAEGNIPVRRKPKLLKIDYCYTCKTRRGFRRKSSKGYWNCVVCGEVQVVKIKLLIPEIDKLER